MSNSKKLKIIDFELGKLTFGKDTSLKDVDKLIKKRSMKQNLRKKLDLDNKDNKK